MNTLVPTVRDQRLYDWQKGCCFYCLQPTSIEAMTRDHIVPQSKGGGRGANLVLACARCNVRKADSDARLFLLAQWNVGWDERVLYFTGPAKNPLPAPRRARNRAALCVRCKTYIIQRDHLCAICLNNKEASR